MLGHMFKSSSSLPVRISIDADGKVAKIKGDPGKQMIVFAPPGEGMTKDDFNLEDEKGRKYLKVTLTASQLGNGTYHPAAQLPVILSLNLQEKMPFSKVAEWTRVLMIREISSRTRWLPNLV